MLYGIVPFEVIQHFQTIIQQILSLIYFISLIMGNNQAQEQKRQFLIVICKYVEKPNILKELELSNIKFEIFHKIQQPFEKMKLELLKNILTTQSMMLEVMKKFQKHHLQKSKLYIYGKSGGDVISSYIQLVSLNMKTIVKHFLENSNKQIEQTRLQRIKDLSLKKIVVKVVLKETTPQVEGQQIIKVISSYKFSYELFYSIQKFKESTLFSISDYIITYNSERQKIKDIIGEKYDFKICIMKGGESLKRILVEISNDKNKRGCQTLEIKQVLLLSSSTKQNGTKQFNELVTRIQKESIQITVILFNSVEQIIKKMKLNTYNFVLVLDEQQILLKKLKEQMKKLGYSERVVIAILKRPLYIDKFFQYKQIPKFFYVYKRVSRSIDLIIESFTQQNFDIHLKQIDLKRIKYKIYTNVQQFKKYYFKEEGRLYPPFVVCTYRYIKQLTDYLRSVQKEPRYKLTEIICFDHKQNIRTLKNDNVFEKNQFLAFQNSNIKSIVQFISKSRHAAYLLPKAQNQQKQFSKYYDLIGKFKTLARSTGHKNNQIIKMYISPFGDYDSQTKSKNELGFLVTHQKQQHLRPFLQAFSKFWIPKYNPIQDFKKLKQDVIEFLYYCLQNQIIVVNLSTFEKQYSGRILSAKSLTKLSAQSIYIYSLPHGLSECLNKLFIDFQSNLRVIRKFAPFVFLMMLKFCTFFQELGMQKKTLNIFVEGQIKDNNLKILDHVYNLNFLNCVTSQSKSKLKSNIQIEFSYFPLKELDFFSSSLFIEPYSFYKQSFEYLFAPYSEFIVIDINRQGDRQNIKLKNIHTNIFLEYYYKAAFTINRKQLEVSQIHKQLKNITLSLAEEQHTQSIKQKVPNILLQKSELDFRLKLLNYYQYLIHLKQGKYYIAQHYIKLVTDYIKKQASIFIGIKHRNKIDRSWLCICNGKYYKANKILNTFQNTAEAFLKNQIVYMKDLIKNLEKRRETILKSQEIVQKWQVAYNPNSNTKFELNKAIIKWQCSYDKKLDVFTMKDTRLNLKYYYNSFDLKYSESINEHLNEYLDVAYKSKYEQNQQIGQEFLDIQESHRSDALNFDSQKKKKAHFKKVAKKRQTIGFI